MTWLKVEANKLTSFTHVYALSRGRRQHSSSSSSFVPRHSPPRQPDVDALSNFVRSCPENGLLVLTGAGISTESGIPDYRSEEVGLYATSSRRPMQHKTFMDSAAARRSYWARNFVAWPRWSCLQPNSAHKALTTLEARKGGPLLHVVTQNVDQLHFKAGSSKVLELHGTNSIVKCTRCSYAVPRLYFQSVLKELNPDVAVSFLSDNAVRPDGDLDIPQEQVNSFVVPPCAKCTGILKPDVVFFGDNVPLSRVKRVEGLVEECESLLVIGSSLHVYSGYRIVLQAKNMGKRVAILNIGVSRADGIADVRIHAKASDILNRI